MAEFISVPATIIPASTKTADEGIEWAKSYVDGVQSKQPSGTYVTAIYMNLKTNQSGQVLSTAYAELVKRAFNTETIERVFVSQYAVAGEVNSAPGNDVDMQLVHEDAVMRIAGSIDVQQIANDVRDLTIQNVDDAMMGDFDPTMV